MGNERDLKQHGFKRIAIFGVGLIGGSFALALKKAGVVQHVIGVGRSAASLQRALELGIIDEIALTTELAVRDADLILIAAPVAQTAEILSSIVPYLQSATGTSLSAAVERKWRSGRRHHLPKRRSIAAFPCSWLNFARSCATDRRKPTRLPRAPRSTGASSCFRSSPFHKSSTTMAMSVSQSQIWPWNWRPPSAPMTFAR